MQLAKRARRFNLPRPLKIRNLIPVVVLIVIGFGIFGWLRAIARESPYFKINRIEIAIIGRVPLTNNTIRELLSIHKGRNMFDVDLKATRNYIVANYPEIREVVINRVLPNKLVLTVKPRKPVAQISMYSGFYLVDVEGVVIPGVRGLALEGLPIINGADPRFISTNVGKRFNYMGLKRALKLLEIIKQMRFSQDHEIHMIDITDEKNLSLYIEGGIEIKIGGEDFGERLEMLNKTFNAGRLDKNQIRYIDLRFGNVVIGPK